MGRAFSAVIRLFILMGIFVSIALPFQNCSSNMEANQAAILSSVEAPLDDDPGDLIVLPVEEPFQPQIVLQLSSGPDLYEGSAFSLMSIVDFNGYTYQWFFLPEGAETAIAVNGATSAILHTAAATAANNGDYWLRLTDARGSEFLSNRVEIDVQTYTYSTLAVSFDTQPASKVATSGDDVVLTARASSETSEVDYFWQVRYPGETGFSDIGSGHSGFSGQRTRTLTIIDAQVADVATYRLRATNSLTGGDYREAHSGQAIVSVITENNLSSAHNTTGPTYQTTLQFNARTILDGNVLSSNADIVWEKRNSSNGNWSRLRSGGEDVTGTRAIITANPNHSAYRARVVNFFDQWVSRTGQFTHAWYRRPWNRITSSYFVIRFERREKGGFKRIRYLTRMHQSFGVCTDCDYGFSWIGQQPGESAYGNISGLTSNQQSLYVRRGWLSRNDVYGWDGAVQFAPRVQDQYGALSTGVRATAFALNSSTDVIYTRIAARNDRNFRIGVQIAFNSDSHSASTPKGMSYRWQYYHKKQKKWVNMPESVRSKKSILISPENWATQTTFRVQVTWPKNSKGETAYARGRFRLDWVTP